MTLKEYGSVPIIDFKPFINGDETERLELAQSMVKIMKEVGFMYITNHGISKSDQQSMFRWSQRFFSLSQEQKFKCPHPENGAHHRGYSSIGKEKVVQMIFDKDEVDKLRTVPDVKESFDLGNENNKIYYNIWPDESDLPGFKEYCLHYFQLSDAVGKSLLRAIALGMGLEEDFFLEYHLESNNQLRLLHYPSIDESALKKGKAERIAAHTDFGTITMLLQDSVGGLQVEDPHNPGVFIDAPYVEDSLIVNTGDFLMRWSNDQLKSTLHRVTAPPVDSITGVTMERFSIPFFISADPNKIVDALKGTFSDEVPKKYEQITAGEYLNKRLNATYV